jgi:hypothetical protein
MKQQIPADVIEAFKKRNTPKLSTKVLSKKPKKIFTTQRKG